MQSEEKANRVLEEARKISTSTKSWIEFSNSVFGQRKGLIWKSFETDEERQAFLDSKQYDEIQALQISLMTRFGIANSVATKSGKFIVRIPKTLHSVLEIEAHQEGVSLNQLALAKLSVPLHESTDLSPSLLIQAFSEVHQGYSADRIICDPALNLKFLRRCRAMGLTESDYELNHSLFNIRKTKKKGKLPRTVKRTEFGDYDEYIFACEIAARYLQRQEGATLDGILCDPRLQQKYDEVCSRLVPTVPILKLRYGALNLRKTHRLQPEESKPQTYDLFSVGLVERVNLEKLPQSGGTYVFYNDNRPIFAGETDALRCRIDRHLQTSDRRGLPRWLGLDGTLKLRYADLPKFSREERLRWLRQFINEERPILNYQKVA